MTDCQYVKQFIKNNNIDCCKTCHLEADEHDFYLYQLQLPDGKFVRVCCEVVHAYNNWFKLNSKKGNINV